MKRAILLAVLVAALFCIPVFGQATSTIPTYAYATAPGTLYPTSNATKTVPLVSGNPPLFFLNEASNTAELVSCDNPLPTVGTFSVSSIDIFEVGGVATWASLDTDRKLKVNVGSFTAPLPTGTNVLGSVGIDQTTPGTTNAIQPAAAALGSASANTAAPLAVQAMVSDNTNLQRILAPIILGDGVNGNNMMSAGGWVWNGTTWDRMPGNASGVFVIDRPLQVASTTVGSFTTGVTTITLLSGAKEITIALTGTDKEAWMALGSNPSVGNGIPVRSNVTLSNLNPSESIRFIASETIGAVWVQR